MIDATFRNVNRLFVLSFKNRNDDPTWNYLNKYYMPLVDIKDFNALIDSKPFFDQPEKQKTKNKKQRNKQTNKQEVCEKLIEMSRNRLYGRKFI